MRNIYDPIQLSATLAIRYSVHKSFNLIQIWTKKKTSPNFRVL